MRGDKFQFHLNNKGVFDENIKAHTLEYAATYIYEQYINVIIKAFQSKYVQRIQCLKLNIKLNNAIIVIFDYFVTLLIISRNQQSVFFVSSSK